MIDIFGTLGPVCRDYATLRRMFSEGMTGIRINLSHVMLSECKEEIETIKKAADDANTVPKILIDMKGPELRIGSLNEPILLKKDDALLLGENGVFLESIILEHLEKGMDVLLDDGKISGTVDICDKKSARVRITRGGILEGKKSIAIIGHSINLPALCESDRQNIALAKSLGITGVMQPFVRNAKDIKELREALGAFGASDIRIYAKVENMEGVHNLQSFLPLADEIIIARGDLGNALPLWELPGLQKKISQICRDDHKPFMVVTQMLSSMEHSKVPTRAEVSDIYNAVLDGASSVMVTGETAVGENPVEVIEYLAKTARAAEAFM